MVVKGADKLSKKKNKNSNKIRSEPKKTMGEQIAYWFDASADDLAIAGYTRLSDNPEVQTAVDKIADMVSNMTIYLMRNTDKGDVRVKNHKLARKVDINPNTRMTRKNFIKWIVRTMYLGGDGNAVVYPIFRNGELQELQPLSANKVRFVVNGLDYTIDYQSKMYSPDEVMHFVMNPDEDKPWLGTGFRVPLKDIVDNLKQAAKTKKGFMGSKYRPSIVVSVDADVDELSDENSRDALVSKYLGEAEAGKPWVIPDEFIKIEQIKPLSLKDLAINESVELDKKTVAAIIGVPPYLLGIGEFNQKAHNHFIDTTILSVAQIIQQTLTRDLIIEDDLYFQFNQKSLYQYDINTIGNLALNYANAGKITGNEARSFLGFDPIPELDELIALENYIPVSELGNQNKLNGGGSGNED